MNETKNLIENDDNQIRLDKEYEETHINNSNLSIVISAKIRDYNEKDFKKVLEDFAVWSKDFYMELAKVISNKPWLTLGRRYKCRF